MEAPIEHAEKAALNPSSGYGSLVGWLFYLSLIQEANELSQSAGICASVKTSKVPITVKAKTDITCNSQRADLLPSKMADLSLGQTIELLMWNG